jgi:hypothetical protein
MGLGRLEIDRPDASLEDDREPHQEQEVAWVAPAPEGEPDAQYEEQAGDAVEHGGVGDVVAAVAVPGGMEHQEMLLGAAPDDLRYLGRRAPGRDGRRLGAAVELLRVPESPDADRRVDGSCRQRERREAGEQPPPREHPDKGDVVQ